MQIALAKTVSGDLDSDLSRSGLRHIDLDEFRRALPRGHAKSAHRIGHFIFLACGWELGTR
jgi:hypothetical protein